MKYNFDAVPTRRGTHSVKWDSAPQQNDLLPLWVADMDFPVLPAVARAVQARAAHPIYGYSLVPDAFYTAIGQWMQSRHGLVVRREQVIYTIGVVPALSACIKAFAPKGSGVLTLTPVYTHFFSSIRNNGCRIIESPLRWHEAHYEIDFADLEEKAAREDVHVLALCNPHNPGGRVWTREELEQVAQICQRHGVRVISDEIHCEIVLPTHHYTPFACIDPTAVTLLSPTKGFNFAGLQIAYIVSPDAEAYQRIDRAINDNEVCDVNPFGVAALIAAYTEEGAEWLEEMTQYVASNYAFLQQFLRDRLGDNAETAQMEGTYLAWVRGTAWADDAAAFCERLKRETGVWFSEGTLYGAAGEGFLRINLACPRATLQEALERFTRFVLSLKS